MKKWVIAVLISFMFLIAGIYIFIPNTISIRQNIFIGANREGLYRNMSDEKNWSKWWPGNASYTNRRQNLSYNNSVYLIDKNTFLSIFILIVHGNINANTSLDLIVQNVDSVNLTWTGIIPTSYNPVKRLQIYFASKQINKDIKALLKRMQWFFSKKENVYGYDIRHELVKDSILISTYKTSRGHPSTEFIYELIDRLRMYIASLSAKETGFPMLNIITTDSIN